MQDIIRVVHVGWNTVEKRVTEFAHSAVRLGTGVGGRERGISSHALV